VKAMPVPAIRVEHLGKQYQLGLREQARRNFGEALMHALGAPLRRLRTLSGTGNGAQRFWALRDVSFEVQPGEVLGVIGANGAGKSTLLKILSRITEPTTGRAELRGSVASLLEVGTGFHPELTGRENIYLNGAILGLTRAEIRRRFDAIVDFAGVERFLDTPVKRYSSGMYVRLAFAVAAHLEAEILLIDEVLAVGDTAFQAKCLGTMERVARRGRTIVFVSHNLSAVRRLCTRALVLEQGRVALTGDTTAAVEEYLAHNLNEEAGQAAARRPEWARPLITAVRMLDAAGRPCTRVAAGEPLSFELDFACAGTAPLRAPVMGVVLNRADVGPVAGVNTRMTGFRPSVGPCRAGTLRCHLPEPRLLPGQYTADIWLGDGPRDLDVLPGAVRFRITEADVYGTGVPPFANLGSMYLQARWEFRPGGVEELIACHG